MINAPDPSAPPPGPPARWRAGLAPSYPPGGFSEGGAIPRMETVRITAPDLARRALMERARGRLTLGALLFALLFGAVGVRLAFVTVIAPMEPRRAVVMPAVPSIGDGSAASQHQERAMITDRNGEILAISLPTSALYANPHEMIDTDEAARRLHAAVPRIEEETARRRLASERQFVYLARQITPREQAAVNALGIPGVYFESSERRHYPLGRTAVHVLGGVDVDGHGIAGVERYFDQRLREDIEPLRLSLDVRVQAALREILERTIQTFSAIGGAGAVMDVRTGEVLAMVSLPDFDAADIGRATIEQRFNRITVGVYEPGSTFKLLTAAAALEAGTVRLWSSFDASRPIRIGRFTISDYRGKNRTLSFPEVIAYSSNIGAAQMAAQLGVQRHRAFIQRMGMMSRQTIELPETALPLVPREANWRDIATMTIGFGHGIAVTPLHVVTGVSALSNGGILYSPTILARDPDQPPREGVRVIQPQTSDMIRRLMRLVVTNGSARSAEVPGYFVGGKTGTAEKPGRHGYNRNARISAFAGAFPINDPRYAIYIMVDEPKGTTQSHGFATGGWVAAPAAHDLIVRIGPMLGVLPETERADAIQQSLYLPLQPARPAGGAARNTPPRAPSVLRPPQVRLPPPVRNTAPIAVQPSQTSVRHEAANGVR